MTTQALTAVDATDLHDLEQVVEQGLATFVEVGKALATIKDRRLYRETHETFEAYCSERWGISRSYAYRQIDGAQVAEIVSPNGDSPAPASEAVARELAPLKNDPEKAREAWGNVVELHGPKPTAGQVRETVEKKKPAKKPAKKKTPKAYSVDELLQMTTLAPALQQTEWLPEVLRDRGEWDAKVFKAMLDRARSWLDSIEEQDAKLDAELDAAVADGLTDAEGYPLDDPAKANASPEPALLEPDATKSEPVADEPESDPLAVLASRFCQCDPSPTSTNIDDGRHIQCGKPVVGLLPSVDE
jgi:hypothetical protein